MLSDHIWAVPRSTLDDIRRVMHATLLKGQHRHLLGSQPVSGDDLAGLPPEVAAMLQAEARAAELQVDGGVTVINLRGVITPYSSLLSLLLFGSGAGLNVFRANLRAALANDDVSTIVLNIDSPGGRGDLVSETADEIAAAGKPIIAVANTLCASAAYWIAAAADEVIVTPSGYVGSVGAYRLHEDWSGFNEQMGIDPTYVYAGEYKVEGNIDNPLSAEARQAWQEDIDDCYAMFVNAVAKGRGVKASVVKSDYGQGRVVRAKNALAAGMVDRVATLEQTLGRVMDKPSRRGPQARSAPVDESQSATRTATLHDVEIRSAGNGKLIVSGYAAVFERESVNVGGYTELVKRGAFRKVLKSNPDVRFRSDHWHLPLARTTNGTLRIWEDAKGLPFEAELLDVQASRDLMAMVERRDVTDMSYMFRVQENGREWIFPKAGSSQLPRREISEFSELFELAAVAFSGFPDTTISVGPGAAAAAADGRIDASELTELLGLVQAGDVTASDEERAELDEAARLLDVTTPWQRTDDAPRATGDEPEGGGAAADPPGETDDRPDTEAEGQSYGLAARTRRLDLVELEIELDG